MNERVYVGHEDVVLRWSKVIGEVVDATVIHVCNASFVDVSFLWDPWSGSPPGPQRSGTARICVYSLLEVEAKAWMATELCRSRNGRQHTLALRRPVDEN